ncbi:MAG: RNA-directed DNA polymerase, partial [bacterium]|nr:RNA-directed DNA polymerase [bacterium]
MNLINRTTADRLRIPSTKVRYPTECDVLGGLVNLSETAKLRVRDARKGFRQNVGYYRFFIVKDEAMRGIDVLVGRFLGGRLGKGSAEWRRKYFAESGLSGASHQLFMSRDYRRSKGFVWRGQHTSDDIDSYFDFDKLMPSISKDDYYEEVIKNPEERGDDYQTVEEMIEEAVESAEIDETRRGRLRKIMYDFQDVFARGEYDVGKFQHAEMEIPLKDESKIHRTRHRRMPLFKEEIIKEHVRKLVARGWIRPSNSQYSSAVVLVKKPHGNEWRLCVDYRKLNANTIRDLWPLKNMHTILERLSEKRILTVVDLRQGFFHLPIKEEDKNKTAFDTPVGLYELHRANYGMLNTPSCFQRAMDDVFIDDDDVEAYIDDCVLGSMSTDEHLGRLPEFFGKFRKFNMKINLRKCQLFRTSIEFL